MIARSGDLSRGEELRRMEALAKHELACSGYYALRSVSCAIQGDVLRLDGRVATYYEKQLAQSVVLRRLRDQIRVENQLEVTKGLDR
ncbi:MAG: hypothetical protein AB7F89_10415 [Pirellulaceae bacterium]